MHPQFENAGDAWCVHWDQGLGDIDLVIPKAYRQDNSVPISGSRFEERNQIIVLGVAYMVLTGTGPLGVQLVEKIPGGPTRTLWEVSSATAAIVDGGFQCYWPLAPASSDAATPASDPARLSVVRVGSVVSAHLTVWGVHSAAKGRVDPWSTPPFTYS